MLPWIAADTIEVLAGARVPDYDGSEWTDWSDPTVVATIDGCSVQPLPGTEYLLDREAVTSRWQVWTPIHPALTADRRIRYRGRDLEIDGSVQTFPDPTGAGLDHCTFFLREVIG